MSAARSSDARTGPLELVLGKLDRVHRKTDGEGWTARCPAHEDRNPSLTIAEGDDGRVLVTCWAGCTADQVVHALGLELADLFPARELNGGRRLVETYDYVDESGQLLFQVARFEPKGFAQRRPDGNGGWTWSLGDTRRVLYRLPIIVGAIELGATVYVVEGERDVHAVEEAGQAATCNPGGAGKWRSEYAETFRGATVVVVADRDEPGRQHAATVAASLEGVAASVRVVEPAEGKDVADHLAAGRKLDELNPTGFVETEETDPTFTLAEFVARRDENARGPLVTAEQGTIIAAHSLTLVPAKAGDGKTTFAVDFSLHAAAGLDFCGLSFPRPLNVLWVQNEGPRDAFQTKLDVRLSSWEHATPRIWDEPATWGLMKVSAPEARARLREIVRQREIDLVISDSLTRFGMSGNGTPEETRAFMEWLTEIGLGSSVAFLLLHHPRSRAEPGEDELDRLSGAWQPHADQVLPLKKLGSNRARLGFPKTRWARGQRPASILAFDPETETFTFVADEADEERDYLAELVAALEDGDWRTVSSLRQPKSKGGIGAREDAIREAFADDRFEQAQGEEIGRRRDAIYYRLKEAPRPLVGVVGQQALGSGEEEAPRPTTRKRGGRRGGASDDPWGNEA